MGRWGEDVDYEAMELKDHQGRFTMNFKKIFMDVDEISERTLEVTDKHPKDSLMKLWAGTMLSMFVMFFLSYQALIFIMIPFFVFYFIALVRIGKCWKGFHYSPAQFWIMSICTMIALAALGLVLQHFAFKLMS